jgi:hypothetical protein
MGVGMCAGVPDGPPGVSELAGDLPVGHAVAIGPPNRAIVVHSHHVLLLRVGVTFSAETFTVPQRAKMSPAYALTSTCRWKRLESALLTSP